MGNKISVITVVYNDVKHIRKTMESFFSQTWEYKEYIVIDGGSTDGTVDVIREYSGRLAFWCSEKDDGIYDAMNKGISHVTGDWINILNSGDEYVSGLSLEKAMTSVDLAGVDVIYGNSIEKNEGFKRRIVAGDDYKKLEYGPTYRHGSSLIRADLQRRYLYDLSQADRLGYALDWYMIFSVYKGGARFRKVDVDIEIYDKKGVSNHPYKNLFYNYKITSQGIFSLKKFLFFIKLLLITYLKNTKMYLWLKAFAMEYMVNDILPHIPFWNWRRAYLRLLGTKIGAGTFVMKRNYFMNPNLLTVGQNSHINRGCILDARGGIIIGDNVSVSHRVNIMTGSHDMKSDDFCGIFKPIEINDYAWLGVGCTILQNVVIGKGAVVCAGAVVTRNVEDFAVVAGVPAKKIGERTKSLDYKCRGWMPFT